MKYDAYLEKDGERRVVVTKLRPTQDIIDKLYPGWTLQYCGGHFRKLEELRELNENGNVIRGYTGRLG